VKTIYPLKLNGHYSSLTGGFTTVQGLAYGRRGRLYVLESPVLIRWGLGSLSALTAAEHLTTVAPGLSFPSGITFGPDGKLYVSNFGFGAPPGAGQVVRVDVSDDDQ